MLLHCINTGMNLHFVQLRSVLSMSAYTETTVCLQMYTLKKKTANTVRPGSVSVTESGFISQQKRSESSVSWGAFVLTSDREQK